MADVNRDSSQRSAVRIEPWGREDVPLLERLVGARSMMEHLGGAESTEKICERQHRYEQPGSGQFKIVEPAGGEGVGWVGYLDREWRGEPVCEIGWGGVPRPRGGGGRGEPVYEIGWSVLPSSQGRGLAVAAGREALDAARSQQERRFVHAF